MSCCATEEAEAKGLVQLFKYSHKNSKIKSQYGVVSIAEWLQKEKERIENDSSRIAEITKSRNGMMTLFVNPVVSRF